MMIKYFTIIKLGKTRSFLTIINANDRLKNNLEDDAALNL